VVGEFDQHKVVSTLRQRLEPLFVFRMKVLERYRAYISKIDEAIVDPPTFRKKHKLRDFILLQVPDVAFQCFVFEITPLTIVF